MGRFAKSQCGADPSGFELSTDQNPEQCLRLRAA